MNDNNRNIESQQVQASENALQPFESTIIPKLFWLGGLQIDVSFDENLYRNRKIVGEARYPSQSITLDSVTLSKQSTEQNYFHELTHWILYMMNEDDLRNNEKFVDVFATFLYQARITEQRGTASTQAPEDAPPREGEHKLDT